MLNSTIGVMNLDIVELSINGYSTIKNAMKKKKDEKIQRIINYTVIIVLSIVCTFSYCRQQKELEISDITMCKIIDVYRRPGTGVAKSKLAIVEYYVSGKRFERDVFFNSKYSDGVGDCF